MFNLLLLFPSDSLNNYISELMEYCAPLRVQKRFAQKLLCFKDTFRKVKSQPTDWEKISIYHIFNKGLASRVY